MGVCGTSTYFCGGGGWTGFGTMSNPAEHNIMIIHTPNHSPPVVLGGF